jgi:hypothetical protein
VRFKTTLELAGKTATGFRVPASVVEALGKGNRPPVVVTINGYTYRNTVAVYGDEYLLGVAAEHRAAAGVTAGDELDVDLELDQRRARSRCRRTSPPHSTRTVRPSTSSTASRIATSAA